VAADPNVIPVANNTADNEFWRYNVAANTASITAIPVTMLAAADRMVAVRAPRISVDSLVAASIGAAMTWVIGGAPASGVATCGAHKRVMDVDNDMATT